MLGKEVLMVFLGVVFFYGVCKDKVLCWLVWGFVLRDLVFGGFRNRGNLG